MNDVAALRPCASPGAPALSDHARDAVAQRILIVMHDFAGGGTEHVAIALANHWARAGRQVRIFCGTEEGPTRSLLAPEVEVEPCRPRLRRSRLSRARLGVELAAAAARFKPQAVFAPGNFHLLVMAVFAVLDRSGATSFCKISNPICRPGPAGLGRLARRTALRILTSQLDTLVAMSPALHTETASALGSDRVVALWEPIIAPIPQAQPGAGYGRRADRDDGLILAVGRLERQKDFALAIHAMARLAGDRRLVILGEGEERENLRALAERLGMSDRILLPGHVRDVRPWMRRARCFLMTSRYEGYPAALVEALAAGLPAVVTPFSPAVPEILSCASGAGLIVPADPNSIAAALRQLLEQDLPEPLLGTMFARHEPGRAAAAYLDMIDRRWRTR